MVLEGWAGRLVFTVLVLVGGIGQKQVRLECALLMGTVCISCLPGFLSSGRANLCITLIVVRCVRLTEAAGNGPELGWLWSLYFLEPPRPGGLAHTGRVQSLSDTVFLLLWLARGSLQSHYLLSREATNYLQLLAIDGDELWLIAMSNIGIPSRFWLQYLLCRAGVGWSLATPTGVTWWGGEHQAVQLLL